MGKSWYACGDGLFEVDPAAAVKKTFRAFVPDQMLMLPPSLDEWLPEGHLARFVAELVDEVLDLGPILASWTEKRGFPPYDPRLMVRLLIYGYITGVRSSRAIEGKCTDDVAFRHLAAGAGADYRSISRFRARHLDALAGIFTQSLRLAQRLGMDWPPPEPERPGGSITLHCDHTPHPPRYRRQTPDRQRSDHQPSTACSLPTHAPSLGHLSGRP
jgi:transposase